MWLVLYHPDESDRAMVAFPLPPGSMVIGRGTEADLVILDSKISSRHVELFTKDGEVSFRDLGSRRGTRLNGEPAGEGALSPGDRLQLGSIEIGLADTPPRVSPPQGRTVHIADLSSTPLVSLEALGGIVERLRSIERSKKLLNTLLEELTGAVGAERGYVLIREGAKGKLVCVASVAVNRMEDFLGISSTVFTEAIKTGETIVVTDTDKHPIKSNALSMAFYRSARSIVCCPLKADNSSAPFGVVYLDMPQIEKTMLKSAVSVAETLSAVAAERLSRQKTRYRLVAACEKISALQALSWENRRLVLGDGPSSAQLKEAIAMAARSDSTCLITGETGTGKEMVARALHHASPRRNAPFVPVNCAALPRDLVEAELFGAEKGAYTGADKRRLGRFELAQGGSLFLDEVGELPLDIQVKLLRVLQERTLTRVGGSEEIELDFRLICATNRNLEECVRDGTFRSDLFFRINVFPIRLPPLRERPEEIIDLAEYFLTEFANRFGRNISGFTPDAERLLIDYDWPGNVRELRNAIERAVVIEKNDRVTAESLPIARGGALGAPDTSPGKGCFIGDLPHEYEQAREIFERAFIERSLAANGGNIAAVVRETGLGRPTVYRWLKKFGLRKQDDD